MDRLPDTQKPFRKHEKRTAVFYAERKLKKTLNLQAKSPNSTESRRAIRT